MSTPIPQHLIAPEVFTLTSSDRHSATWARILQHLKDKLERARALNDGDNDAATTAKLRGQIGTLKALIALDREPPPPPQ